MILESIVTTIDPAGQVNIAPMGPQVDGDDGPFTLKPFASSRTYQNLIESRRAVIHVTDDAKLFAQAAVGAIDSATATQLVRPLREDWRVLHDCHRWFAVEIESITGEQPRLAMKCRVVDSAVERPFFGFNRAKYAVLEAAILATRTHLLPSSEILDQFARLQPLIDKTGGSDEHDAFQFLQQTVHERLAAQQ